MPIAYPFIRYIYEITFKQTDQHWDRNNEWPFILFLEWLEHYEI